MTDQEIPDWMQPGTDFDIYWNAWQDGRINYLQFARAIQEVDDVPDEVKESHMNSAEMVMEEMNKALYVYTTLRECCPDSFKRIMDDYDPDSRYSIVTGVSHGKMQYTGNKTYH